jgi:FSR family fosmidomycin resistance protein-like MFS transporter
MAEIAAVPVATPAAARRTWLVPLVLYCMGHFAVDMYQGTLGALQPALQDRFRFNFTQAGILAGMFVCSASMMQPLYGYLSDRFRSRLLSAVGPAIAAVFISTLGWAHGFGGLLLMVFMGGVGIAAFHPQAASNAVAAMSGNRGNAMAIFISCGFLGLATGPAFFSVLLRFGGLDRAHWGAIPGVVVALLLMVLLPPLAQASSPREKFEWAALRAVWKPMVILYVLVLIRSIVQVTFAQFLPLYLHTAKHYTVTDANLTLSLYLVAGAIGGFAGGNLADRLGGRLVILISMIGSVPFLVLFLFGQGVWSTVGLIAGGLVLLFTMPVNIVMAQELAPTQAGTVSALMMGFAWGSAGLIFIPLTGWVSDHWSMQLAFTGLIFFPLLGFLLAMKLPRKVAM